MFPLVSGSQPTPESVSFCTKLTDLAEMILQMAVRVIFISASVLIAASALPLVFHAVLIPVVAISSTLLAGFFFIKPTVEREFPDSSLPPLIKQREVLLPLDAPKGLLRTGNNCSFNAMVQFLESDPAVAKWLREQPPAEGASFEDQTRYWGPLFDSYVENEPHPRPSREMLFARFMKDFSKVRTLRAAFYLFLMSYDRGDPVDSQMLREALNHVNSQIPICPVLGVQQDVPEIMEPVLDIFPERLKMFVRTEYFLDTQKYGPIDDDPVRPVDERTGLLTLEFDHKKDNLDLVSILNAYLDHGDLSTVDKMGKDGQKHPYPMSRGLVRFLEPPSSLRLQLVRHGCEVLEQSWLDQVRKLPPPAPRTFKKDNSIQIQTQIELPIANGTIKRYRLSSFVHHAGGVDGGHYTAGRVVGGNKYLINDKVVTPATQGDWESALRQAYLLCYLEV
jgi:hypothetical protein